MNEQPLVSILIPVLNREKYLTNTLNTVLSQTYRNWECIVIDDESIDNSQKIVLDFCRKDKRFRYYKRLSTLPSGSASCRNMAIGIAQGSFINFLDSDDILNFDCIEKKVDTFFKESDRDIIITKSIIHDESTGKIIKENRTSTTDNILEDYITRKVSWYIDNPMIRADFLKSNHIFSSRLKAGQDRDFFIKILLDQPKLKIIDYYGSVYNRHIDSISGKMYNSHELNSIYNYSHYQSLVCQVDSLKSKGVFTDVLRAFYFQEILKKFPSVHRTKNSKLDFYQKLINLTSFNFYEIRSWIKLFSCHISFVITGKGERFLK